MYWGEDVHELIVHETASFLRPMGKMMRSNEVPMAAHAITLYPTMLKVLMRFLLFFSVATAGWLLTLFRIDAIN
jgi:hypothetical protein